MSFSAWGERQVIPKNGGSDGGTTTNFDIIQINDVWNKLGAQIENSTTRGFTGHEHFDQVGIIHMNGRIYDPSIGRFLQADPLIQDPYNTQSLNRYSYVMNNPLSYTDPSGYARLRKGWWRTPLAIGISVWTAGVSSALLGASSAFSSAAAAATTSSIGGLSSFLAGVASTLQTQALITTIAGGVLSGAVATGSLKGAVKGGIMAAVTFGIGHGAAGGASPFSSDGGRYLAHATVAGISSEVDGGKFGYGFVSSYVSIGADSLGMQDWNFAPRIVANAIVSGTISQVTGGKFANGAMSAAFRVAFNDSLGEFLWEDLTSGRARDRIESAILAELSILGGGLELAVGTSSGGIIAYPLYAAGSGNIAEGVSSYLNIFDDGDRDYNGYRIALEYATYQAGFEESTGTNIYYSLDIALGIGGYLKYKKVQFQASDTSLNAPRTVGGFVRKPEITTSSAFNITRDSIILGSSINSLEDKND